MIHRIDKENYCCFADMVYWREHGQERVPAQVEAPEELNNPNLWIYAAEAEGRFVGWISLVYIPKVSRVVKGHVYVDELWVQPDYRRRGIAKALLAKADELAAQLEATGVRLYVNTQNPEAQALYEAVGFCEDGTALFMEK